jgi:hypothetical protein
MTARLLGYWKASLRDSYALPQHFEASLPPAVRKSIVAYLDSAPIVNQTRGHSYCRYGCGDNGSAERTDGEWVWPTGLSHYVKVHNVALPREFIDHIERTTPPSGAGTGDPHIRADENDWLCWSDERMPTEFKTEVRNAIAEAERLAAIRLEAAVLEMETERGLEDAPCMGSGCDRRPCRNYALCARCLISGDGTEESIRHQCEREQLSMLLDGPHDTLPGPRRSLLGRLASQVASGARRLLGR